MNTLTLSKTLQEAGLDRKPAEAIAQAIDEKNSEIVTRAYLDNSIRSVKELLYFVIGASGAALGYIITKIN
jgi:hypothetical protein